MNTSASALQGRLKKLGVDALLFNTSEITPSANLRYLSGFTGSDAALVITGSERHLFTDGRYKIQAQEQAPGFLIHVVKNKMEALTRLLAHGGVHRVGVEGSRLSYEFATTLGRKAADLELVPLARRRLEEMRIRKSPEEKATMQRAAAIASEACKEVLATGLHGRKECDVAAELELRFRQKSAEGIAFETIVASGPRSALPHGKAAERVIGADELVVVDYGCRVDGYHSDETVTCITGKASADQRKIHETVYAAHMRAIEAIKVGIRAKDVDAVARKAIAEAGYSKYFLHGLGHGVGLEIHEPPAVSPRGTWLLDEGMVFTVEPGIYVEGTGGVRLESLVYLGRGGPEILSAMSKDLLTVG